MAEGMSATRVEPDHPLPFGREPRIGILVVAYNAATTLAATLDRIPEDFWERITEVFICDDASQDGTHLLGLEYQRTASSRPITVVHHRRNLGYGGNQKSGYRLAAEHDLDIVVLLHADGQYAPECLPAMIAPLERGLADAVFGSRMMEKGSARAGGMPLYKFVGNRILTTVENRALGSTLSEFHSGYRAYSVRALSALDLTGTADGFNFDTQIIIALHSAGKRIVEIPIPTYYGDEICYVNGMKYATDVLQDVGRYRLATLGFTNGDLYSVGPEYQLKEGEGSSHAIILELVDGLPRSRVLDVGCSAGRLGQQLRDRGHHVTGVDLYSDPSIGERLDEFLQADLEDGLPERVGGGYDLIIAADVLEHLRNSDRLLQQMGARLAPGGRVLVSVPNFGHWYPRLRTLAGLFDYDQRGILDRTHVRFFTRRSLLAMMRKNGFEVQTLRASGLPLGTGGSGRGPGALIRRLGLRAVRAVDRVAVRAWPTLFAYQFVLTVSPVPAPESVTYRRPTQSSVDPS